MSGIYEGVDSGPIRDAVTTKLADLGITSASYSHVMHVMPGAVSLGGAAAYAYVNWYLSVYSNGYARVLLVLMHEIG